MPPISQPYNQPPPTHAQEELVERIASDLGLSLPCHTSSDYWKFTNENMQEWLNLKRKTRGKSYAHPRNYCDEYNEMVCDAHGYSFWGNLWE